MPCWRPTSIRLQCPHCDTPLRDRHIVPLPGWLFLVILGLIVCVQLATTGWVRLLLSLALLAAVYAPLVRGAWRARKDADNPHRFVEGSYRFWAQGNEQLQRHPGDTPR